MTQRSCRLAVSIITYAFLFLSSIGFLLSLRVEAANLPNGSETFGTTRSAAVQPFTQLTGQLPPPIETPSALLVSSVPTSTAAILSFFDANRSDLTGPNNHDNNYGKKPEIVVVSTGTSLTVLAQNYHTSTTGVMLQI